MMHTDAYTLCNLDSQTYSTLPAAPYHHNNHQQHYQSAPTVAAAAYLRQNDTANYFQHAAAECFRGANWASCGATSGHVIEATSGSAESSCIKRSSRGAGAGFYDGGGGPTAAMMLYGHHPGVARPPGAAAFEFPFSGFCAGGDVAPSNTSSGCGYAAAAAAAFYGVDSANSGVLRSRSNEYGTDATALFYPGYGGDQAPQPAHLTASNGLQHHSSIELCSGAAGSEFTALCRSGQQPHSPTVTASDPHRGESNCSAGNGGSSQNSGATYKWMTVKRGAPKSTGQYHQLRYTYV